jgi:hypothetical protein
MLRDATQSGRLLAPFLCIRYVHFVRSFCLLAAITCASTRSTVAREQPLVAGRRRNGTLAQVAVVFDAIERQIFVQIVSKENLSFNDCEENMLNKGCKKLKGL